MANTGTQVTLQLNPQSRLDVINISSLLSQQVGDLFSRYRKVLYYSYHTTAGYLDQKVCARFNHHSDSLQNFLESFQRIFPPNASYQHDKMDLREELTEAQKLDEPSNGDAHLTFIGSGLTNCVTYLNEPDKPVFFIDLDGINGATRRHRYTTVLGFNQENKVVETMNCVPVSNHAIDSINLKDERLGLFEEMDYLISKYGIERGRFDITLESNEQHAGLTVNEYETLLMKVDLAEVLSNPFRFMAEKGRHMVRNPKAIPSKAKGYAKYDLVQFLNELIDALGLSESIVEKLIHKFMAFPAARFLRMKRSISLLAAQNNESVEFLEGAYQSPILVQWKQSPEKSRNLRIKLVSLD